MNRYRHVGAALLLLAGIPALATAQARGYVGLGGGMAFPTGTFGDAADTGYLGQIIAGITGPSSRLGGRVDGMFISNDYGPYTYQQVGVMGDVVLSPRARAKTAPYLLAGLGFVNGKTTGTGSPLGSETKLAFNAGGGLDIRTRGQVSVYLEARWVTVRTEVNSTSYFPVTIGLRWGGM